MHIFISREERRKVVLASTEHVLTFQSSKPSGSLAQRASVEVELKAKEEFDPREYDSGGECFGCLGLVNAGQDIFLCVIVERSKAATPTPQRTVWNIHAVDFIRLRYDPTDLMDDQDHPCSAVKKFFALGGFLYSSDFDLTSRAVGGKEGPGRRSAPVDPSFMWNQFMAEGLNKFRERLSFEDKVAMDEGGFTTTLIRGFAATIPIQLDHVGGKLTVLSRQSWLRAGTRFNSRGIDDEGNVANFVESETVLWLRNGVQFGFLQLRGSVPLFWEQAPQLISAKISITRPDEAAEPAFRRHFDNLADRFGAVHVVDLLASPLGSRGNSIGKAPPSEDSPEPHHHSPVGGLAPSSASIRSTHSARSVASGRSAVSTRSAASGSSGLSTEVGGVTEADLSVRYQSLVERVPDLRYTHFDFHKEVSGIGYSAASKLIDRIQDSMLEFGFYSYDPSNESSETEQIGVFRVNCLDCLDRTNLVQQLISKDAMDLFLEYHRLLGTDELWNAHATLWADNGDQLSQNYTGTGALKSSFTRSGRMNLAGALSDVSKSVGRLYINNFVDQTRQSAMEEILGKAEGQVPVQIFDPINDHVREQMEKRTDEYQSQSAVSVFCGTFNLNGKTTAHAQELERWLLPDAVTASGKTPDVYVIGFQELVELTASQVLNVDPTRRMYWEELISQCLNSRGESYFLLRSGQLVGTAIMLFVKKSHLHFVTEVEGTSKKTALSGITGNKGGVAIGFKYANTRFMAINSHMAAGVHNVEDRNNDYKILSSGLRLTGNRRMKDADVVLWCGDLNYRVGLPNDTVRKIIEQRRDNSIGRLLEYDQLTQQMVRGETFHYFDEQPITFNPTYKFDPGTDEYDSSDKQRVPSWTDRILWRSKRVRAMGYSSVPEIRFSDHRPVYALFEITVSIVDKARADELYNDIYDKRRRERLRSTGDDASISSSETRMLEHPSTDSYKWWNGSGYSTKINMQPPRPDMWLNPDKTNPFGSKEPDYITRSVATSSRMSPSPSVFGRTASPTVSVASSGSIPPPVPASRNSSVARRPVGGRNVSSSSSASSLMDAPITTPVQPLRSSGASVKSQKSTTGSLMDADDGSMSNYKSLI